jgi:Fic family protein
MPDLLDRVTTEIRARLEASRAAVAEYERLEAALRALDGGGGSAATSGLTRREDDALPGQRTTTRRGSTRKRAPRGANREAVLRVVSERPGVTAAELAAASGVERNTLYALLATLTKRGELERHELPGGKTGYALARG